MRARKMDLWMIVGLLVLGIITSYGFSQGRKAAGDGKDKDITQAQGRTATLKRASLQLWENVIRL